MQNQPNPVDIQWRLRDGAKSDTAE